MQRRRFLRMAAGCGAGAAVPAAWWLRSGSVAEAATEGRPIVCNQLGYPPKPSKLATLRAPSTRFTVRDVNRNAVAMQGKPPEPRDDAASGDRVQVVDFSQV